MSAGVDASWTTGIESDLNAPRTDFSVAGQRRFVARLHPEIIEIQIRPHAPRGFQAEALGYALPFGERGVQVVLYSDRVEVVSNKTLAAFYRVLGYALAHEIGHVLLRSTAHENVGLMKGVWTKSDWHRAAVTITPFSPDQALVIAERLRRE